MKRDTHSIPASLFVSLLVACTNSSEAINEEVAPVANTGDYLFDFGNDLNLFMETSRLSDTKMALAEAQREFPGVNWKDAQLESLAKEPDKDILAVARLNIDAMIGGNKTYSNLSRSHDTFIATLDSSKFETGFDNSKFYTASFKNRGNLTILIDDSYAMGELNLDGNTYHIRPLYDDYYAFKKIDDAELVERNTDDVETDYLDDKKPVSDTVKDCESIANEEHVIDFVVGYTDAAEKKALEMKNEHVHGLSILASRLINLSLEDSNINTRVKLKKLKKVNYQESSSHVTNINALKRGDGELKEIHDWRKQQKADIAILIVHNDSASDCGRAGGINIGTDDAFAVANWQCINTKHSYAHEIGHLLGARHDDDPNNPSYAHGYITTINQRKIGTIMATQSTCRAQEGCWRSWFWSNPDVSYSAVKMGHKISNNNACEWRRNAGRIAQYGEKL